MSASKASLVAGTHAATRKGGYDPRSTHIVQFYREDRALISTLANYFGPALSNGDAAIVVATYEHHAALKAELKSMGHDVNTLIREGRYQAFEAPQLLAQFMVDGMPDATRFLALIGRLVERAKSSVKHDSPCIVIFGEMVAILWAEGKHEAAIKLEGLWNDLAKQHSFTLRCAYPMTGFTDYAHAEPFMRICTEHTSVIPDETFAPQDSQDIPDERSRRVAELQQKLEALEQQKALHQIDQQLRLLVEAVHDYAIFMLDPDGRVKSWNRGAQRIKGYKATEIIGKHFSVFYPPDDISDGKPQRELEIAIRDGRLEDEGWRVRKDGSKFWANVIITPVKDSEGTLIGFGKVTRDATEKMLAQRELEESQRKLQASEKSLRQLSLHLLRTQDEERRRIGRDLHDSLGQNLAVLKMKLDSLVNRPSGNPVSDANDVKQCAQMTDEAVKEVRTISYLLYPPMLEEMGLKSAIPWYLEGFMKRSGIATTFSISADFKRLPSEIELAIFRVLQEGLTNVHRHSGSETADVRLSMKESAAVLEVSDHGQGLKGHNFEKSGQDWVGALGVGLRGMNERMRLVGGSLEMSSSPEGTTITATVPMPDDADRPAESV
jgi:PAS domain S-box-containing protein